MDIASLIIEAVGGNVVGAALKDKSLGRSAIPLQQSRQIN